MACTRRRRGGLAEYYSNDRFDRRYETPQAEDGAHMTIPGSGSVIAQPAAARLIDEYQFMIDPLVPASGRSPFQGLPELQRLRLTDSRQFSSGVVLLSYQST